MRRHEIQYFVKDAQGVFLEPAELLAQYGAILNVVASLPKPLADNIARSGAAPPQPVPAVALIDTGCTRTAIDQDLVGKLALPFTGAGTVQTAKGAAPATYHAIHLFFPDLGAGQLLPQAMACDLAGSPYKVLLGTDLLRHCVLVYDGLAGRVVLLN